MCDIRASWTINILDTHVLYFNLLFNDFEGWGDTQLSNTQLRSENFQGGGLRFEAKI